MNRNYILDAAVAEKKMRRMALEIVENNAEERQILLVGIKGSGTVVAACIRQMLKEISPQLETDLVTLTLDKRQPSVVELSQAVPFDDRVVILVDDVANSGRTLLYALKPFLDHHPKKIQVLVLVARSHNSFPVHPDYVGLSIATTLQDHIYVEVDTDNVLGAYLA